MPKRKIPANSGEVAKYYLALARLVAPRAVWGKVAQTRGDANEQRLAYLVVSDLEKRRLGKKHILPDWIDDYSLASSEEDVYEKTDAYVHTTDVGKIRVQIKSSQGWCNKAREQFTDKQKQTIALVLVNSSMSDDVVLRKMAEAVDVFRQRYLEERRGYAD